MDDESNEMPIVEDESDIPASSAIAEAIQNFLSSESDAEDEGSDGPSGENDNSPEDQSQSEQPKGQSQSEQPEGQGESEQPEGQSQSGQPEGESESSDDGENQDEQTDDEKGENEDKGDDKKSEAKKESKEKSRKEKAEEYKKKLKDDAKKGLMSKITTTFLNPASQIPADIQQSLKETGKTIKETSQKAMQSDQLKPHEKAAAVKEIATETTKTGAKQTAIETILKIAREALKRAVEATSPWSWLVIAILVAVAIILIILLAIMVACSGGAAGGEASTEPEYMTENFSITSECFYGIRAAYIDEDLLISSLQQSYKQYTSDVIVEIEENGIDVTIDIITINEETRLPNPVSSSSEPHYNTLSLSIGNSIAGQSESSFNNTLYNAISYFGFNESQQSDVNDIIVNYIKDNSLFTLTSAESFPDDLVDQLNSNPDLDYVENLCEKVMIKDYIASDSGLKDVEQLIYVGSVYMPNKDITITDLSTVISTTTPEYPIEGECILKTTEGDTVLVSGTSDSSDGKLLFDSIEDSNLELPKFNSINSGDTKAFSGGISLFEALRLGHSDGKDYSLFFQKQTNENGDEVYSWKPADEKTLYLTYKSDSKFIFTDLIFEIATEEETEQ